MKKYKGYILSFFLPFFIFFVFLLWKGCFSNKTILSSDMQAQYVSLFQYLKNILTGSSSFPYSFSKGLGGGMYGAYFYYLSNPLNLLVYFFDDIPFFLMLLVLLKISLSGLTMYTFLRYSFKEEKSSLILFSLAYALMSYNINYYVNVMWLDGVVMAPLLLLSIDRFLHKGKTILYSILLFTTICMNYYIGYILVLFSILYFFYLFLQEKKKNKKQVFSFLIVTLLTGFMTSFILIPCGLELLNTTRVLSFQEALKINWNFLDFIAPTYIGFGNLLNPLNYFGFCVFSGTIMIPLVICYFTNSKITKREKRLTFIMYFFFLLPIVFPLINMVWHMFTIPAAFNYRYSFITTLFTIMISYRSWTVLECSKKALRFYFLFFLILSCSLGYVTIFTPEYYVYLTIPKIGVTIFLVGMNIFFLLKNKKIWILCLLGVELIGNLGWIGYDSIMSNKQDYLDGKTFAIELSNVCEENKRCDTLVGYTSNDSFLGNYSAISNFLSTTNGKTISFLSKASNYSAQRNFYYYHVDRILDMLLGVDIIETTRLLEGYEVVKEIDDGSQSIYLVKNSTSLSLGYLVSSKIKDYKTSKEGFFFLEELLQVMKNNQEQYLIELPLIPLSDTEYLLEKDSTYPYLYIYTDKGFIINGEEIEHPLFVANDYVTIYDEYGDSLLFELEEEPSSFKIYTIDTSKLVEFKESTEEFVIDKLTGNKVVGHISASQSATLLMTIPYENGWKVYIDGIEVDTYKVLDTFVAVDITEGEHTIEWEYHIYGLNIGIVLSIISFLLLLLFHRIQKKKGTTLM